MHYPVDDIGTGRICERALIVIEWIYQKFRSFYYLLSLITEFLLDSSHFCQWSVQCFEEFIEIDVADCAEIHGS